MFSFYATQFKFNNLDYILIGLLSRDILQKRYDLIPAKISNSDFLSGKRRVACQGTVCSTNLLLPFRPMIENQAARTRQGMEIKVVDRYELQLQFIDVPGYDFRTPSAHFKERKFAFLMTIKGIPNVCLLPCKRLDRSR